MAVANAEIAKALDQLADLLEIADENPFRVRAYRNAARVVHGYPRSMSALVQEGSDLTQLPGIGTHIAAKIRELVRTGELRALASVKRRVPEALADLTRIQGLGPARVRRLYRELKVRNREDLQRAAERGRIRTLKGFGVKTEQAILQGLERFPASERRTPLYAAEQAAEPLLAYLKAIAGVKRAVIAGSYRRRQDTVGDLDFLVTARKGSPVMDRFVRYDDVSRIVSHGSTRATVILRSGLQVDLRLLRDVSYGAGLHYFTGSKSHNIAIRKLGVRQGLKFNEYGVFRGDERLACSSEADVYAQVGLPCIEPELRENRGEIEAAFDDNLPLLVSLQDIKGDLHAHTNASDGHDTLQRMADAAAGRGYEYLAITDHSKRLTVANGLDARRFARQFDAIDRLNDRPASICLLKSGEVDILEDGSLDVPEKLLARMDIVICSIHYRFDLPRARQTERILRALDNPHVNVLAHPTGRLINERPPYDVDLRKVLEAAAERGCCVEVNCQPNRMDLTDDGCRMAKECGVQVAISTDAHGIGHLDLMRFGVDQARRGWLTADDVINTRPLADLRRLLRRP